MRIRCDDDEGMLMWCLRNGFVYLCIAVGNKLGEDVVVPWVKKKLGIKEKRQAVVVQMQGQVVEADCDDDDEDE